MPNAPSDQFTEVVIWKGVPLAILAGIGVVVLRELLHWIDRRSIRAVRPVRKRKGNDQAQEAIDEIGNSIPRCPLCNGLMVKRTVRSGTTVGSSFWGCFGYPRCDGTRPMGMIEGKVRKLQELQG